MQTEEVVMKKDRHDCIQNIINQYTVQTQDELIGYLRNAGFDVTQATVSRDIRELKLSKLLTEKGVYRYTMPPEGADSMAPVFNFSLMSAVTSIDHVQNIIVMRTTPGMAQAVAFGIDNKKEPAILGCVAGDDTIIVIVRDHHSTEKLCVQISGMIGGK